ncbi:MAG: FliI/YscN family ATPase [Myxococcales bacterium]|nr:FliI/YscN family ATPase [Myxococcales bacterium]MCB9519887.1 FliI/YscN family ATPase [Myxococcales bacterium]MCB9533206.1 FliI/YscN family ATPase [Myxococcales bacterium]
MADTFATRLEGAVRAARTELVGRIEAVSAGRIAARVPDAKIGRCYAIERADMDPLFAQLVGFDGEVATLLPFAAATGVAPGASVRATDVGARAPDAYAVAGDVIDALGRSLVSGRVHPCDGRPLDGAPPSPLTRRPITDQLATGVRVVDTLLPLGVGQRVGLFAGSGVGKSTLLAQLARGTSSDSVIVALVGERGREVSEFVEEVLGAAGAARATVVVATSDAPPLMRARAAEVAMALAEQRRANGEHCLLLVDSLTRYARALRESATLAGEPPARRGYPASVFAALPRLLERAGTGDTGAVTAIFTVLVEGGDMEEPVADEVRGIVDGHWVLTRSLAERGHFPAVDVLASVSRVAGKVVPSEVLDDATRVRGAMSLLARHADAIDLGIYEHGTSADIDLAIAARADIDEFLRQPPAVTTPLVEARGLLAAIARSVD